jgi:hypothetical protein
MAGKHIRLWFLESSPRGLKAAKKSLIAVKSKWDFGQTRDATRTGRKVIRRGMGPRPTHSKEFPAIPEGGFACLSAIP